MTDLPPAEPLLHVVLFKFQPHATPEIREELKQRLASLGEACGGPGAGILAWQVDWNRDTRKGYDLMEAALFASEAAFRRFHAHPAHGEAARHMSRHADWVVGDIAWPPAAG